MNKYGLYLLLGVIIHNLIDYIYIVCLVDVTVFPYYFTITMRHIAAPNHCRLSMRDIVFNVYVVGIASTFNSPLN